ncbi:MAG TPA: hypothetical protein DIU07_20285, partial [Rhodobacteraceae bacterium]|nr:hypothetical protein [Paracoccaceae bacterium]
MTDAFSSGVSGFERRFAAHVPSARAKHLHENDTARVGETAVRFAAITKAAGLGGCAVFIAPHPD